jgi:hypothetical protein
VGDVGVHLGAGGVARDEDAVGDPQVGTDAGGAAGEVDAERLQAEGGEGKRAPDGQHHLVPLDGRAVREVDHVRARHRGAGLDACRANAGPDVDAVAAQAGLDGGRVARMVSAWLTRDCEATSVVDAVAREHLATPRRSARPRSLRLAGSTRAWWPRG